MVAVHLLLLVGKVFSLGSSTRSAVDMAIWRKDIIIILITNMVAPLLRPWHRLDVLVKDCAKKPLARLDGGRLLTVVKLHSVDLGSASALQ